MNPSLLYWTAAWLAMGAMVTFAAHGIRAVRRGQVAVHRRSMGIAALLVVAFLISYVAKVGLLGHEDRSLWTGLDYGVLYFHETCILIMLLAGGAAGQRAFRMRGTRTVTGDPQAPFASPSLARSHRWLGRCASIAAVLAWVSAGGVLWGMFRRAFS